MSTLCTGVPVALQELLVEGPLTNLKSSMVALSQPKRKFDRAAFGVGGVGMGAVGAIGRYHPPEKVGDQVPSAANGTDVVGDKHREVDPPATAADAVVAAWAAGPGYSPFTGPSYGIPSVGYDSRVVGVNRLGGRQSSSSSQMGPSTQPDFGLNPNSSQSSFNMDGLVGLGGYAGLTGISSQVDPVSAVDQAPGAGLDMPGFPAGFSQSSFALAGTDDVAMAGLGVGVLSQQFGGMTLGALEVDSSQPYTQKGS